MNEGLEKLIADINVAKNNFYFMAIPLHKNETLRNLTKILSGVELCKNKSGQNLTFTDKGLAVKYKTWVSSDWGSGHYTTKTSYCTQKDNRLYATTTAGQKELLELFPGLTIQTMKSELEKGIRESQTYKTLIQ